MKGPSLQISATLSLVIHIVFIILALVIMKRANYFVKPSPYIVRLVGPDIRRTAPSIPSTGFEETSEYPAHPERVTPAIKEEREYASDRIEAIKAKRKIKDIIRLRGIISLKGSTISEENEAEVILPSGNEGEGSPEDLYTKKIGGEIWQHYEVIPELKGKNLEAIISITVLKDGTIKINRVEKSSGNILFDRSVLKTINKASPVSSPPYEMEIGLRFTP